MEQNVQDLLNQKAEVVFTEVTHDIILVNPNPFLVYEDTIGGKVMRFAPLKTYSLRESLGRTLVERAAENRRNTEAQAQSERQHWAECISSLNQRKKDMAMKFCERVKGANSDDEWIPKTRVLPFPGLVDANSAEGQKFVSRGLAFMDETKDEDLEHYLEHYRRFVWDPEKDDKKKKGQKQTATETAIQEAEERQSALNEFVLDKPDTGWELEQKVGYIERLGDKKVPKNSVEDEVYLNERMQAVYEAFKAKLDKAKVAYTEV